MNKGRVGHAFLQTAHLVPGLCAVTKMATGTRLQRLGHETRQVSFPDWGGGGRLPCSPLNRAPGSWTAVRGSQSLVSLPPACLHHCGSLRSATSVGTSDSPQAKILPSSGHWESPKERQARGEFWEQLGPPCSQARLAPEGRAASPGEVRPWK